MEQSLSGYQECAAAAVWSSVPARLTRAQGWHPLSNRNQTKLAEAQKREGERVIADARAREEFAAAEETFRNLSQLPSKEAQRLREVAAVSFMYQRPPGYDAMLEREAAAAAAAAAAAEGGGTSEAPVPAGAADPFRLGSAPASAQLRCLRCRGFGHEAATCSQPRQAPALQVSRLLEDPLTLMRARSELQKGERLQLVRPGGSLTGGLSPPRGGAAGGDLSNGMLVGEEPAEGDGGAGRGGRGRRGEEMEEVLGALEALGEGEGGEAAVKAALDALPKAARRAVLKAYEKRERRARRAERREGEARAGAGPAH